MYSIFQAGEKVPYNSHSRKSPHYMLPECPCK